MQELQVWGIGGPDGDSISRDPNIIERPLTPRTLAAWRDPSIDYPLNLLPPIKEKSIEEQKAEDERQAEVGRRWFLPSPEYVPKYGDNGTEGWSDDIRIYTRSESGVLKFWGVRDVEETMEEFWARRDPEDTRHEEPAENVGSRDVLKEVEKAPEATPPRGKTPPRQSKKGVPKTNSSHRVKKPAVPTSPVSKSTRRSLGSRKHMEHQESLDQAQEEIPVASSSGRPTRMQGAVRAPERQEMPVGQKGISKTKAPPPRIARTRKPAGRTRQAAPATPRPEDSEETARAVETTTPPKRRQGQGPAKGKSTPQKKTEKMQKNPVTKGNAHVAKQKKATTPSAAPSVHTMRTRARGSAEKNK